MFYLDRIESLLSVSGVAVGSAFNVMLLEQLITSILNSDLAVIPRI